MDDWKALVNIKPRLSIFIYNPYFIYFIITFIYFIYNPQYKLLHIVIKNIFIYLLYLFRIFIYLQEKQIIVNIKIS